MSHVSQNGYSVVDSLADCKYYPVSGATFSIPLRDDNCGYVLAHLAGQFHKRVEPLNRTDCHGYNKRQISGSSDWSNHASATAEDLNATQHAYGRVNTFNATELANLRKVLENYDGVIKWGGDYRYTKDEMHFEIIGDYASVSLVARRLRRRNKIYLSRLKPGNRNLDVYMVKRALKNRGYYVGTFNNYFSVAMKNAYAEWQKSLGYSGSGADGLPGKASLEKLGFKVI